MVSGKCIIDWNSDGVAVEHWVKDEFLTNGGLIKTASFRSSWGRSFYVEAHLTQQEAASLHHYLNQNTERLKA